jgi:hypothetical protein
MKRTALLLITLFCSAIFLFAGDKNSPTEMIGWVCNAKCVEQTSGAATCNKGCSESSGDVVFINSKGDILQISNQQMAAPMAGKQCKLMASKDPSTGVLAIQNIVEYRGP